jgi:AcrR family transcriptional regulator
LRVKSAARRARIAEAAWAVFSEKGFEKATVDDIAARAGCSKPTIYTYFASKQELFLHTIVHTSPAPPAEPFQVLAAAGPLADRLLAFAKMHVALRLSAQMVAIDRIVIEAAKQLDVYSLIRDRNRAMRARLAQALAAEAEQGRLTLADPFRAAVQFLALIEQDLRERRLYGDVSITEQMIDDQVRQGVDAFLRSYGVAPASL